MTKSKIFPAAFLVTSLVLSGAVIANAQSVTGDAPDTAVVQTDFRGEHGPRGDQGPRGMRGMFQQVMTEVDADGDGAVTQVEIDTFRSALVEGADTSGDGNLTIEEFETIFAEMVRDHMVDAFQDLDGDGDGNVTAAEMDARFGGIVERMDRNGDGALSADDRGGRGDRGEHRGDRGDRG